MGYPTPLSRTKNWGTEILTDEDLEAQLDIIINWVNAAMDKSGGHKHDSTTSEGPTISKLSSPITDDITFSGNITFSNAITIPETPTSDTDGASKGYVDTQIAASASIETGMIILWSGAEAAIPSGWNLCDGNNSTPDLTDRFVIGAGGSAVVDSTGGPTLAGSDNSLTALVDPIAGGTGNPKFSGADVPHRHNVIPPYYALAYIMKT